MDELTVVHGPLELVPRSSLYADASVTALQLSATLVSVEEDALRPVGAGAFGHAEVFLDTFEDALPKVVESGEPSPLALTRK